MPHLSTPTTSRFHGNLHGACRCCTVGAATPLAKALLGSMSPLVVAGLFYLGSGVGLGVGIVGRRLRTRTSEGSSDQRIRRGELPWLIGAIVAGALQGPALLMRAVQLRLGHTKRESTVRYLGIEVDDALEMAEQTEV